MNFLLISLIIFVTNSHRGSSYCLFQNVFQKKRSKETIVSNNLFTIFNVSFILFHRSVSTSVTLRVLFPLHSLWKSKRIRETIVKPNYVLNNFISYVLVSSLRVLHFQDD